MHYILGFFFWFLMRGPITLGAAAVAILGLGFYLQVGQNERNEARLAAIAAGPPPAFEITKYDRDRDMTDQREVVVRAQPVFGNAYRFTYAENSRDDYAYMVPLVASNGANEKVVFGIALYHSRSFTFDDITPELMMEGLVGFGDLGPILEMNGRITSLGKWQDMTDEAFVEQGMTLAANPVIVWPYLEGRAAALAPTGRGIFEFMSYIAGALGLLALVKLVFGQTKKPEAHAPMPPERPIAAFEPIPPQNAADAVPLWKQRAGLAEGHVHSATQDAAAFLEETPKAPTYVRTPVDTTFSPKLETAVRKQRSSFGIRKALIGVVGGLFVLGLVSVVTDLIAKSAPVDVVQVDTFEKLVAATAADIIVPDADPNRHWTDLDVTPVIEWFVAKGLLAMSGDIDAIITLGMIVGGLFFGLFGLRFYFVMRRSLRPKTTANFGNMGIN